MSEAAASRTRPEHEVTFEVYVRQRGRWIIHSVLYARAEAVEAGQALARERAYEAVRVVQDDLDLRTGESRQAVIVDTEIHVPRPAQPIEPARAEPRRPARPEPEIGPRAVAPTEAGPPWLVLGAIGATAGLTLAGIALWLFGAAG